MKLEKSNETCWSIKRKNNPGIFSLRYTESGGTIVKISITLNDTIHETKFEMNISEFENFFGIISSFKDLINPSELKKQVKDQISEELFSNDEEVSENQSSNLKLSSDSFNFEKIVADLEKIDINKSDLAKDYLTAEKGNKEEEKSKKTELKETDWDPW